MLGVEALALSIAKTCGGMNPDSEAFRLRNPGLLKNQQGKLREFRSWVAGFKALCFDLLIKCSGESRCKYKRSDPLSALLSAWDIKSPTSTVTFLRRALQDESITHTTPLERFV